MSDEAVKTPIRDRLNEKAIAVQTFLLQEKVSLVFEQAPVVVEFRLEGEQMQIFVDSTDGVPMPDELLAGVQHFFLLDQPIKVGDWVHVILTKGLWIITNLAGHGWHLK